MSQKDASLTLIKLILSTLVGSLVVVLTYFLGWNIIPDHCTVLPQFLNTAEITDVISSNVDGDGVYIIPKPCALDQDSPPYFFASIREKGHQVISRKNFIKLFCVALIPAFSLSMILLIAKNLHFGMRLIAILLIIFFSGTVGYFPSWNWNGYPLDYVFMRTFALFFSWLFASVAMAALTRGKVTT